MDKTYGTKKYAADKIALLGLFIVALLIAHFITASRSAIVLSEPIKLSYTGLSVSIPTGNGWRSEKQWKYQENAFTLRSAFAPRPGRPTSLVNCRYLLAATKVTPDMRFKQKASAIDGVIAKTGQTQADTLIIDWAHIKKPRTLLDMFFGTVRLRNNRQLDIEVLQTAGSTDLTGQVFERIAESLKFKDNQLLEAGSEIVTEIKNTGLDRLLYNRNQQTFFLVKNAEGRTIGFTMDVLVSRFAGTPFRDFLQVPARKKERAESLQNGSPLVDSGWNAQSDIQAASLFYIRGRYPREQATFFQSDNSFDEFVWKSETSNITGRSGTELILDETGLMTVRVFGPQAEEKTYQLSPAAIPEILLEFTFSRMLDSDHEKIIVDIIEPDGTITPALVSRIEAEDITAAEEEAEYVLRMELLNGRGFSEQIYLDSQGQISKILLRQKGIYTLERTSVENIVRQFPEQADYILKKSELLEQGQSRENSR